MAWNQPGNNGQDRDPWGSGNNGNPGGNNSGGSNKGRGQQSLNLDNIFSKLSGLLGKVGSGGGGNGGNGPGPAMGGRLFAIVAVIAVVIWGLSGFYTIKEGELGVITRFGQVQPVMVGPGLNWKPNFIDAVRPVNTKAVRGLAASGIMLTSDENVVRVEMNVQYQVADPIKYLFRVTNADDSLSQATDSALRSVIGKYTMDKILTQGRTIVREDTKQELERTIQVYDMGLKVLDVNFQAARPPEEVKAAFDDAIAAREDEQRYIRESEAYANEVQPRANGQAQRLIENAKAYQVQTVLEAEGEVAKFSKLLPEYKAAPEITRERLYIESMEKVLSNTSKVLIDDKSNNLMVLPLDQLMRGKAAASQEPVISAPKANTGSSSTQLPPAASASSKPESTARPTASQDSNTVTQQRNAAYAERLGAAGLGRG
ncbi:FtsH protease activity modulator HflK [Budvicia aquatica]|uniref:Protein HflK n=1 Tax=Budvicia aquatica TaxID=82979 RepID=A0A2C6BXS7_9GAMM|nr:FtsH protease activity modulator HflK [Budvicia aquatica]MBP9641941.1 FtsH protease activity modulator HflK [Budvicia sp.]PHI28920.1 FtsH protease activity modulator HflK [Budvicia aquatica]GKX53370.1 protease modulator HflK [Budvicia aquatica]VFS47041.1 Modulator of FtsH protease HflK [Budvicia aquatica]